MKRCNCGEIMEAEDILGYPKTYYCPSCGGTLSISEKGVQRWCDANGTPATYAPPQKSEHKRGED